MTEPLWPILDIWLTDAKDTNNSTLLIKILKLLKLLKVPFDLLTNGSQIPKQVKRLAKKWPQEEVQELSKNLFLEYAATLEANTVGEGKITIKRKALPKTEKQKDRYDSSFTDAAEVEPWENDWTVYHALDDEMPMQIAKKLKVALKDLMKINVWRLDGLKTDSRLEEKTAILIPTDGPNDPKKLKAAQKRRASQDVPSRTSPPKKPRRDSDSKKTAAPAQSSSRRSSSSSSSGASSATSPSGSGGGGGEASAPAARRNSSGSSATTKLAAAAQKNRRSRQCES